MKNWVTGIVIAILIATIIFYIKIANFSPPSNVVLEKINQLELKIDSINSQKDSVRMVIDSTHVKIITNEKHYQERINTIITQPLSVDSQYVSDYIGRYIESHQSYFQ